MEIFPPDGGLLDRERALVPLPVRIGPDESQPAILRRVGLHQSPLPEWEKEEQPCFSVDEIARIIERSPQPYNTVWRLVAETGIRHGEICGLNVGDVDVNQCIIVVQEVADKEEQSQGAEGWTKQRCCKEAGLQSFTFPHEAVATIR